MATVNYSLFLLAAFAICVHAGINSDKIETEFLEKNILSGINESQYCNNPYAAYCGKDDEKLSKPLHLKRAYRDVRNRVIDILSKPIIYDEVTPLVVEKKLFRKCMNLGLKNSTADARATDIYVWDLFQNVLYNQDSWNDVDLQLHLRGFDHAFYDVGVERDPTNPRQHVIVIKPPQLSRIKNLIDWANLIFQDYTYRDISRFPWKYYDNMRIVQAKNFYNLWAKIFSESTTQSEQEKMSLHEWNNQYHAKYSDRLKNSEINWEQTITGIFQRVGVDVNKNESVIIRDKDYFLSLMDLLGHSTNEDIVAAVKTKVLLENLRLIDYNYADVFKHRKKSLFCYEHTSLYGASYQLLEDLKNDKSIDQDYYETLDDMIYSISDVVFSIIDDASDLTPEEQRYLRDQVISITSHGVGFEGYWEVILDNYYERYDVDDSYFASIVKYRNMLKKKELRSLRDKSDYFQREPFSVTDLANPRNRFILNVFVDSFILSKQPIPSTLYREVHYGIYGISISGFLYGLLNENRYDQEVDLTGKRINWFTRPQYPKKSLQCFVGQDVKTYRWRAATETVTQIFGTRIGYKALLDNYEQSGLKRPEEFLLPKANSELLEMDVDKLFFTSYGKYHCHLGKKVFNKVLLNSNEYTAAFECEKAQPQCALDAFQIQNKHHFVNQPF